MTQPNNSPEFGGTSPSVKQAEAKPRLEVDRRRPLVRGLIYEDVPESLRWPGKAIVVDERVVNLKLAMRSMLQSVIDKAGLPLALSRASFRASA